MGEVGLAGPDDQITEPFVVLEGDGARTAGALFVEQPVDPLAIENPDPQAQKCARERHRAWPPTALRCP